MKRKIVTDITILKQKSGEIVFQGIEPEPCEEASRIIKDLEDTLENKGIGLSAVQIGIHKRIAIIRMGENKLDLINPKIIKKEDRFRFPKEGCLSLPGLTIDTSRYNHIVLENQNEKKYSLDGLEAVAVQHEIDHMNGLTILDKKWRKKR